MTSSTQLQHVPAPQGPFWRRVERVMTPIDMLTSKVKTHETSTLHKELQATKEC
ncbi:hypothetical protein T11_12865 [Trichinella zimbabwensis]|uniref:Uncharacterized protein n=1 Tax=Trichinella zimbabwensis TaxID=268475 RepID=A0A0V1GAG7_9BILA|nr:hypothetical protein T11_12865 [Trichinella zimbabwensis]